MKTEDPKADRLTENNNNSLLRNTGNRFTSSVKENRRQKPCTGVDNGQTVQKSSTPTKSWVKTNKEQRSQTGNSSQTGSKCQKVSWKLANRKSFWLKGNNLAKDRGAGTYSIYVVSTNETTTR